MEAAFSIHRAVADGLVQGDGLAVMRHHHAVGWRMASWAGSQGDSECRNAVAFLGGVSEAYGLRTGWKGVNTFQRDAEERLRPWAGSIAPRTLATPGSRDTEERMSGFRMGASLPWHRPRRGLRRAKLGVCFPPWRSAELSSSTAVLRASGSKYGLSREVCSHVCSSFVAASI